MERPVSVYQQRRKEEERLASLARALSVAAAVLFVMIVAQAAGYQIVIVFPH